MAENAPGKVASHFIQILALLMAAIGILCASVGLLFLILALANGAWYRACLFLGQVGCASLTVGFAYFLLHKYRRPSASGVAMALSKR